jgi:hypothetical protein
MTTAINPNMEYAIAPAKNLNSPFSSSARRSINLFFSLSQDSGVSRPRRNLNSSNGFFLNKRIRYSPANQTRKRKTAHKNPSLTIPIFINIFISMYALAINAIIFGLITLHIHINQNAANQVNFQYMGSGLAIWLLDFTRLNSTADETPPRIPPLAGRSAGPLYSKS